KGHFAAAVDVDFHPILISGCKCLAETDRVFRPSSSWDEQSKKHRDAREHLAAPGVLLGGPRFFARTPAGDRHSLLPRPPTELEAQPDRRDAFPLWQVEL